MAISLLFILAAGSLEAGKTFETGETFYLLTQKSFQIYEASLTRRERRAIRNTKWQDRWKFSPSLRAKYEIWFAYKKDHVFWKKVWILEDSLSDLYQGDTTASDFRIRNEAFIIAQRIIQNIDQRRQEWTMIRPAWLQNILINFKLKEKGFCYHWVNSLWETLDPIALNHFSFHWAVANKDKLMEHNVLVVTAKDKPFESGLLIDGWRKAGRPYWMKVSEDEDYSWVEGKR
jgi:hypothetical protein